MSAAPLLHPLSLREAVADQAAAWMSSHLGKGAKLRSDTLKIQPGDVFIARPVKNFSSAQLAAMAAEAGAAAIIVDGFGENGRPMEIPGAVPRLEVPQLALRVGMIASAFYGRPSMSLQLIAVTGTNGKTTLSFSLAHALARSGLRTAAIGTLGVGVFPAGCEKDFMPAWSDSATGGLTTPDAVELQTLLHELKQQSVRAAVLRATPSRRLSVPAWSRADCRAVPSRSLPLPTSATTISIFIKRLKTTQGPRPCCSQRQHWPAL